MADELPQARWARHRVFDQTGFFGDADYERTLTEAEEVAHVEALQRKRQPWIDAAAKARDAWFGEKMAA